MNSTCSDPTAGSPALLVSSDATKRLERIIEAVLYEGYILYPYRASSQKNQQRFTFGRVYPEAYSLAERGAEPCVIQTECLIQLDDQPADLDVSIGFLQPIDREIGQFPEPISDWEGSNQLEFRIVPNLEVEGRLFQTWQEAVERKVSLPKLRLSADCDPGQGFGTSFSFPAVMSTELIRDSQNRVVGILIRRHQTIEGLVEVATSRSGPRCVKIQVSVHNQTPLTEAQIRSPQAVVNRTLASTHTVLRCLGAEFVSLMDPPADSSAAAAECRNVGTWPVLVGDATKAERHTMLSSPIILYDYPEIAPESPGTFFDGTEVDEMLTLRILTMTDEEKREMRHVDAYARQLLERTESSPKRKLGRLHGTFRRGGSQSNNGIASHPFDDLVFGGNTRLEGITVGGTLLQAGDRVRLCPKARADILDLALSGKMAVVEAVEQDAENRIFLSVVMEDDPGKDLGILRQPGHRFFYGVDEVEPVEAETKGCG